jgi:hypothetical protein
LSPIGLDRYEPIWEKGEEAMEPTDAGVGGIRLGFFRGPNDVRLQLFERKQGK